MMFPSMFCMKPNIQSVIDGNICILLINVSVPYSTARVQSLEQSATVVLMSCVTLKV